MLPHDLTVGVIGGFLLWFGWYGFNPGSSLSAMDFGGIGRISANTTLAACTGGLAAEFFMYFRIKKWDCRDHHQRLPGRPGGDHLPLLLGEPDRAPASWAQSPASWSSSASICSNTCASTIPSARGPCMASCGVWGTLSLGLFACGQYSAGRQQPQRAFP